MDNFDIWITLKKSSPCLNDFHRARAKLENLGMVENSNIGIILTSTQWRNFLANLSEFENNFVTNIGGYGIPKKIMGFKIKLVNYDKEVSDGSNRK